MFPGNRTEKQIKLYRGDTIGKNSHWEILQKKDLVSPKNKLQGGKKVNLQIKSNLRNLSTKCVCSPYLDSDSGTSTKQEIYKTTREIRILSRYLMTVRNYCAVFWCASSIVVIFFLKASFFIVVKIHNNVFTDEIMQHLGFV